MILFLVGCGTKVSPFDIRWFLCFFTNHMHIVMTPASLDTNFNFELKKCGDPVYRKNQHWTFHPATSGSPFSFEKLSLDAKFVETNHGAWIPSPGKQSNFSSLSDKDQIQIDRQINHMIANKYQTYHYMKIMTCLFNRKNR